MYVAALSDPAGAPSVEPSGESGGGRPNTGVDVLLSMRNPVIKAGIQALLAGRPGVNIVGQTPVGPSQPRSRVVVRAADQRELPGRDAASLSRTVLLQGHVMFT